VATLEASYSVNSTNTSVEGDKLPGLGIKIVPFALRFFPRGFILSATSWFQRQRHQGKP